MSVIESLLNFIYPLRCGACGGFIRGADEGLCPECRADLRPVRPPLCSTCGLPFSSEGPSHVCGACSTRRPPFAKARSAHVFSGAVRRVILNFKFGFNMPLACQLGEWLTAVLLNEFDGGDIDSVIPVPLHIKRLRWRGFNQALLLSREISKTTGLWVDPHTLKRVKETRPQTRLSFKERKDNVKGAFAVVRENFVRDRSILLVDDVYTTGETLKECARVLEKAGAARVEALTVARAIYQAE